jgi:hypothetical protein
LRDACGAWGHNVEKQCELNKYKATIYLSEFSRRAHDLEHPPLFSRQVGIAAEQLYYSISGAKRPAAKAYTLGA